MDLFEQLKFQPLWFLLLLAIASFSIINSFYSILTRLYVNFCQPPMNLTRPTDGIGKGASTSASNSSSTADSVAAATVYEVFLSFCGKDTRKGFTDFLYTNLVGASIQTFRDNDELRVGEEIGPELLKAIKESKISIPVFSKNYAYSKWCLLELEQIVECHKNGGQKIFPIFYDVDPSHLRNQEGSYKLAFNSHKKKFDKGTIQRWRDALKVVGLLKGLELKKEVDGHEGEFVKKVVEKVVIELKKNYTHVPQTLVGMDNHIEELMGLLEVDSVNVRIIGIHGMGGLGKTTMTKVIYNKMCNNFDGQCFFDNVREKSKDDDGIAEMQDRVSSVSEGRNCGKKLLLVLDDIDDYIHVDRLMGELIRFGARSRIILTTRNKEVLDKIEVNCQNEDSFVVYKSYTPKFMNTSDSLQLFGKHAFSRDFLFSIEEYNILAREVVSIAAGLPLVLVVLGSTFFVLRDKCLWEEKLKQLRKIPNKKVLEKLKISFEALEETEKEIFLDIACLFIGLDKTRPTYMWESCELYPKLGISVLVSRSLITMSDDDKFQMHDQLRDLGRQIVREEGWHGKQSRLWCYEEASRVLELNQGTSCVKALSLEYQYNIGSPVVPHFHRLPNLRYLSMEYVKIVDGDFKYLLPNLRWLECRGMLDNSSLRNLNMKNLVVLHLDSPGLTDDWVGWRQLKMANNLKVLDLACQSLQTLPNLSNLKDLKVFNARDCKKLSQIEGLSGLISLEYISISGCSSIVRLPKLSHLKRLKMIKIFYCEQLIEIQDLSELKSLEKLEILHCRSVKALPDFSPLQKLRYLGVSYCGKLFEIHGIDELKCLEDLFIGGTNGLGHLPDLPNVKIHRDLEFEDSTDEYSESEEYPTDENTED